MIPELLHVPALTATILVLVLLIIIPVIVMTDWKNPLSSNTIAQDTAETTSCALPLTLKIAADSQGFSPGVLPDLDNVSEATLRQLETATFALG
jgi:hypothetical protein